MIKASKQAKYMFQQTLTFEYTMPNHFVLWLLKNHKNPTKNQTWETTPGKKHLQKDTTWEKTPGKKHLGKDNLGKDTAPDMTSNKERNAYAMNIVHVP